MFKKIIFLFIYLILVVSCSKDKSKVNTDLLQEDVETEMILAYKEGMRQLELGDVLFASKKFDEAEIMFPQSIWAAKASLMLAYALLLRPIGFVTTTTLFLAFGGIILGERRLVILVSISVFTSFVLWYLVQEVLGIFLRPWPWFF